MHRVLIPTALLLAASVICGSHAQAASVFGRAVLKDGADPTGPCRATLLAEVDRRGAPDPNAENVPNEKTTFSVRVSARGFFRFNAVPPGKYVLAVACATASSNILPN